MAHIQATIKEALQSVLPIAVIVFIKYFIGSIRCGCIGDVSFWNIPFDNRNEFFYGWF